MQQVRRSPSSWHPSLGQSGCCAPSQFSPFIPALSPLGELVFPHISPCWTPPVWQEWRAKSEIRNPKQFPMSKGASPQNKAAASGLIGRVLRICHLNFVLVSDFEFRISDLSSQGSDSRGSKF